MRRGEEEDSEAELAAVAPPPRAPRRPLNPALEGAGPPSPEPPPETATE
jgi:hypothetical protein